MIHTDIENESFWLGIGWNTVGLGLGGILRAALVDEDDVRVWLDFKILERCEVLALALGQIDLIKHIFTSLDLSAKTNGVRVL